MKIDNIVDEVKNKKKSVDKQENTIASETLQIDASSMRHLMNLLTNIYDNNKLAVFREYIANAVDTQKNANTYGKIPIDVKIISPSDETFVSFDGERFPNKGIFSVRDYGEGMSKDTLLNVYTRYGKSTKNDNNKEIGGFGIGAKSALALTNYFEVSSFKDGVETRTFIEVDDSKVATMFVVHEGETSERNGTLVKIPVDKATVEAMNSTANHFFYSWEKGTILINDTEPASLGQLYDTTKYLPLRDVAGNIISWYSIPASNTSQVDTSRNNISDLFIGGIPYNIPRVSRFLSSVNGSQSDAFRKFQLDYQSYLDIGIKFFFNAPIGHLTLAPDRESIQVEDANAAVLSELLAKSAEALHVSIDQYLQSLPEQEARKMYYANSHALNVNGRRASAGTPATYNYRDKTFHTHYNLTELFPNSEISLDGKVIGYGQPPRWLFGHSTVTNFDLRGLYMGKGFSVPEIKLNHYRFSNAGGGIYPVIIWGKYAGRAKNPVNLYLKTVMQHLYGGKAGSFVYIRVDGETAPPKFITELIKTYEINEFENLGKELKRKNTATAKPRKETYYPVVEVDSRGNPFYTLMSRTNLSKVNEPVYYITADKILNNLKDTRITTQNSYKDKLTNIKDVRELSYLEGFFKVFPDTKFTVIPEGRLPSGVNRVTPVKNVDDLIYDEVNSMSRKNKNRFALGAILYQSPLVRDLLNEKLTQHLATSPKLKTFVENLGKNRETQLAYALHMLVSSNPYARNATFANVGRNMEYPDKFNNVNHLFTIIGNSHNKRNVGDLGAVVGNTMETMPEYNLNRYI